MIPDHRRAVAALKRLDAENLTWVAHAAAALGLHAFIEALLEAHPDHAAVIRGAARLGERKDG